MPINERVRVQRKIAPLSRYRKVGVLVGVVSNKDCFSNLTLSNRGAYRVHLTCSKLPVISLPTISNPLAERKVIHGSLFTSASTWLVIPVNHLFSPAWKLDAEGYLRSWARYNDTEIAEVAPELGALLTGMILERAGSGEAVEGSAEVWMLHVEEVVDDSRGAS